jgi:hypothetical protein
VAAGTRYPTASLNVSDSIVILDFITSKKLFDLSIFIDEKDSNIEE